MRTVGHITRAQFALRYPSLVKLQPRQTVEPLLFDIELEEKTKTQAPQIQWRIGQHFRSTLKELSQASDPVAVKLHEDIERAKNASEIVTSPPVNFYSGKEDALATELQAMGYKVEVLSYSIVAQPNMDSGLCRGGRHALNNKYLAIIPQVCGDFETEEFIVELNFREQFVIQNPPDRYKEVLGLVPEEFIGTADSLNHLVPLVCHEMAKAFASRGRSLPPWRSCEAFKARWSGGGQDSSKVPGGDREINFVNVSKVQKSAKMQKKSVSLLSIRLAEQKDVKKDRLQNCKIKAVDIRKNILSDIANLRLAAKVSSCGVEVDKEKMKRVWADALISQFHRGWFGRS